MNANVSIKRQKTHTSQHSTENQSQGTDATQAQAYHKTPVIKAVLLEKE
jgi:hypothetical protein